MGLDWLPLRKPKEGREAEFDALFKELVWTTDPDPSLWDRLAKITISPYETLKAPRVGTDGRPLGAGGISGTPVAAIVHVSG